MPIQYQTLPEKDFSNGIDQTSSENQIKPGYVEDAENIDTGKPGLLAKRTGYEGVGGGLPFRVSSYREETNKACFTLDSSISLGTLRSVPIVVYGKLSVAGSSEFSNTTEQGSYYLTTEADVRLNFPSGTGLTKVVPLSVHLQDSPYLFVGTARSTASVNYSNEHFIPDGVRVNKSTNDISIDYSAASSFEGIVYAKRKDNVAGVSYQGSESTPNAFETVPVGTTTYTITQLTHQLINNNIGIKVIRDTGTHWSEIIPDDVVIAPNGDVDITLTTASSFDARFMLTSVDQANVSSGSIGSGDSLSIVVPTPVSPFVFTYVYLEDVLLGTLTQVIPDSVSSDAIAGETSVSFTNNTPDEANFFIFFEYADVQINEICAAITGGATLVDPRPQLTIWGLRHEGSYNSLAAAFPGWVQHIDAYKSTGERYLVSGLGGNLFTERTREEVGASHLLPQLYPRLFNRLGTNQRIGPAFVGPSNVYARDRGTVEFTDGEGHTARASSITYDTFTGNVVYTLEVPGVDVNGTLSDIITAGQDYLTVTGAGWKRNEGEFLIQSVTLSGQQLLVAVKNPNVSVSDWDETDSGARCGVFTDRLSFIDEDEWLPGDNLISTLFPEGELEVVNADASFTYVRAATVPFNLPAGLRVVARRSSRTMPLRTINNLAQVTNFVNTDTVFFTGVTRALQIKNVIALANTTVTITTVGQVDGTALVTLPTPSTSALAKEDQIVFFQAGPFSGSHEIVDILSTSQFLIATDVTADTTLTTAKLLGNCVTLDETLTYQDDVFSRLNLTVASRWIPVEAPVGGGTLVPTTHRRHFDSESYSSQPVLRSTMVQDSMFFTNGADEVTKYDGVNVYRAGLPRWQPHLFAAIDTANAAIVVRSDTIATDTYVNSRFHVTNAGQSAVFIAGDRIKWSQTGDIYTVTRVLSDTDEVVVDRDITGTAGGNLGFVNRYRYYFRLNMVDKNQNIVLSATTGANDMIVQLAASATVRLRLLGFPAWDIYDYSLLEVEIYRTRANQVGPFYRVATLPLSFNATNGYIAYDDTTSDSELLDLDASVTALKGAELAPALGVPLRAKYVTSAGNRLVLANLSDYPKLDISITGVSSDTDFADMTGKKWLFSKDEADTGTTTNNVDRINFEWTTSAPLTISSTSMSSGVSLTVTTSASHGLSVGSWVYLYRGTAWTSAPSLRAAGWYQVSALPSATEFTVMDSTITAIVDPATGVNRVQKATAVADVPVSLNVDYNYDVENGGTITATASPRFTAMRRLANAINSVMRMTNTTLSGQSAFVPWMIANAGSEYNAGQIVIEQPRVVDTFLQVKVPTAAPFSIFVNGVLTPSAAERSARVGLFPSRLVASYSGFPETFDAPATAVELESDSAVDVNSADGQEITGIIPFFGDSAFGSAQKDSIIVVFKTNSIYLVNLEAKRQGQDAVQKIDSQGLGCTYPYSIASTRQGIMFANEAGIYRLTRNLTVDYVGRMLERYWDERVNKDALLLAQGHNFALGRQYKLSYPLASDTTNSNVLVYDHTQEYDSQKGLGGWSRFTNHPVTGWANLDDNAFFGATSGRVFALRKAGDATDYRDDDQAIEAVITFRALDFGDAAIRKNISKIILHLRTPAGSSGSEFFVSNDLSPDFHKLDEFEISVDPAQRVTSLKFTTSKSKFLYLQSRLSNSTIDEGLEVTGIDYRLAALKDTALTDAARTKR